MPIHHFLRQTNVAYLAEQFTPVSSAAIALQSLVVHSEFFDEILFQPFRSPPAEVRGNYKVIFMNRQVYFMIKGDKMRYQFAFFNFCTLVPVFSTIVGG